MKFILLALSILFILFRQSSPAQDAPPTPLEKAAWVAGASVAFGCFDYFGFNATNRNPTLRIAYRVTQVLVQSAITWFLYKKLGLPSAIGFNLIWWTFGDDFIYYGFSELVNPGSPWESRGSMNANVFGNNCTWAYWTPVGLARGGNPHRVIAGDTLLAQSLIGAVLGFSITIAF